MRSIKNGICPSEADFPGTARHIVPEAERVGGQVSGAKHLLTGSETLTALACNASVGREKHAPSGRHIPRFCLSIIDVKQ